ncbi:MAG: hypothetical protein ACYC3S_05105 [Chloroflexota bacterium]
MEKGLQVELCSTCIILVERREQYVYTPLAAIDPGRRELSFQDGTAVPFDLLVGVPPHRPLRVIRESPLANEAGWIPVHRRTLATRFPNVYAIGDVTAVVLPNGKLLPRAGVFAHAQGVAVASEVAAQVNNAKNASSTASATAG